MAYNKALHHDDMKLGLQKRTRRRFGRNPHHSMQLPKKRPHSNTHTAVMKLDSDEDMNVAIPSSTTTTTTTTTSILTFPSATRGIVSGDNDSSPDGGPSSNSPFRMDSTKTSAPTTTFTNFSSLGGSGNNFGSSGTGQRGSENDSDSGNDDGNGHNGSNTKDSSNNGDKTGVISNGGGMGNGNNSGGGSNKGFNGPNLTNSAVFNPDPTCQMVNDNDGRLQYTGAWSLESKDPNGLYFTSHTTTTADSQVSITFNGTSVTVIGVVHASNDTNPPAMASYIIDSYPALFLPLPFTSRDIPNQAFFESEELPLGAHKLTLNVTSNGAPYTLSTLKICNKNTSPVAANASPTAHATSRTDIPAILGAVVGSVALILIATLGYIILLRRRRAGKAPLMRNRVLSWLQRRATATMQFTSTESIMRNNPTNPSAADAYDKLSCAEKLDSGALSQPSAVPRMIPRSPISPLKAMPDSPILPLPSPVLLRASRESSLSYVLPVPTLGYSQADRFPSGIDPQAEASRLGTVAFRPPLHTTDVPYTL